MSTSCYAERGPTDCNAGRCFCQPGHCAVVTNENMEKCQACDVKKDGSRKGCTKGPYAKPFNDTVFRLKNSRWPAFYIDVDAFGSVDVQSRNANEHDNEFTLSMPIAPADYNSIMYSNSSGNLLNAFLFASVRWTHSVLRVYKGGSSDRRFQTALQNVNGGLWGLVPDPSIKEVSMKITRAPKGLVGVNGTVKRPFMLSSYHWPKEFLYCTTFRWSVDVHRDDPGAGGYWWFEPDLPDELVERLPNYTGKMCSINCGEVAGTIGLGNGRSVLFKALVGAVSVVWALNFV